MAIYKRVDQVYKTREFWNFWYRVFVSFIFAVLFIGICTLSYITLTQIRPKYPTFGNDVPDSWLYRTQIYADAIYNQGKISHDYRLNKNQTLHNYYYKVSKQETVQDTIIDTKRLVCYYSLLDEKDKFQQLQLADVDAHLCTHINVGCIDIHNSSLVITDKLHETLKNDVPKLRLKNPTLKILIWVGGGAPSSGFPQMVRNHTTRKWFIQSLKQVLREYNLDGVDLDWEFPSAYYKERMHFSQLLYAIKQEYKREKRPYLLSVAVAAPEGVALFAYDVRELNLYADHVNLMSYDYHFFSRHTPFTGLNAPLYARKGEHSILSTLNINYSVNWWLTNGLSADKLVVGLPTYGHSFTLVNPFNNRIGAPASGFGQLGYSGFVTYSELCFFKNENIVSTYYDADTCSPYLSSVTEWISYENEQSIKCKVNYLRSKSLGGVMVFSLNTDDFLQLCEDKAIRAANSKKFPLVKKIKEFLHNTN